VGQSLSRVGRSWTDASACRPGSNYRCAELLPLSSCARLARQLASCCSPDTQSVRTPCSGAPSCTALTPPHCCTCRLKLAPLWWLTTIAHARSDPGLDLADAVTSSTDSAHFILKRPNAVTSRAYKTCAMCSGIGCEHGISQGVAVPPALTPPTSSPAQSRNPLATHRPKLPPRKMAQRSKLESDSHEQTPIPTIFYAHRERDR